MSDDKEQRTLPSTSVGLSLRRGAKYSPLFESESLSEIQEVCLALDDAGIDYRQDRCESKDALPSTPRLHRIKVRPKRKREGFHVLEKLHGRSVVAREYRNHARTLFLTTIGSYGLAAIVWLSIFVFLRTSIGPLVACAFGSLVWAASTVFFSLLAPYECSKNTCRAKLKRNAKVCPQCDSQIVEVLDRPRSHEKF